MKIIIALAFITGIVLSRKLWLTDRFFPHTPLLSFLPQPPAPYDWILAGTVILLLLVIAILPSPRKFLIAFCIVFAILLLLDQDRWQPWVFQYYCMMILLCFISWKREDKIRHMQVMNGLRIIMVGIYLYSGLQKINFKFIDETFPWLMKPITDHLINGMPRWLHYAGYTFPAIEIFIGIGLLFIRTRKAAMYCAVVMHALILIDMSPLGQDYNYVIWPWNIAMILFVIFLFNRDRSSFTAYRASLRFRPVLAMFALFCFMPVLSFFNVWDSYLSASLYSGNTSSGIIYMTDDVRAKLPKDIEQYVQGGYNQNTIAIKAWSMQELGVPGYPEKRVFKGVKNALEKYATTDSSDVFLMYTERLGIFIPEKTEIIE